jgi:hypothetical protein
MKKPRTEIVVLTLVVAGCYRSPLDRPGIDETESGGTAATVPGSNSAGGTSPMVTGTNSGTGGSSSGGGVLSNGGLVTFGGAPSVGGAVSLGGAPRFGGAPSAGGAPTFGGAPSNGGAVSNGGAASFGGAPTTLPSNNIVTFSAGSAQGAMTGPGWVALGPMDAVKSPTCGGLPITSSMPCMTSTTWNSPSALCVTGYIPALPLYAVQADYDNNWGIDICANATQIQGGTLGTSYATIAVTVTGTPTTGLRLMVHRKGDPDATWYCAFFMSGAPVRFTSLNTACWDGTGVAFASTDVPNIDRAGVQVPSATTAITLNNLCMTKIVFGN